MKGRHLLLVLTVVAVNVFCSTSANTSIFVNRDGLDEPECLKGQGYVSCQSLTYVLNNLQESASWTVFINESQSLVNVSPKLDLKNGSLFMIGISESFNIYFAEILQMTHFQQLAFRNLILTKLPKIMQGTSARFYDCLIMANSYFKNEQFSLLREAHFLRCDFIYILDYSKGLYSVLTFWSVFEQSFVDCTFKNNGFSPFLFFATAEDAQPAPLIVFNGCVFQHLGDRLTLYYYAYEGKWMIIIGDYHVIIDNSVFSNAKIVDSTSLISGGDNLKIVITNTLFSYNELPLTETTAMISLEYTSSIELLNVTFCSNLGTSLMIGNGYVNLTNVTFVNNTGVQTGGVSIMKTHFFVNATFNNLFFKDNKFTGIYGGVMYIQSNPCGLFLNQSDLFFQDDTQFIFFSMNKCINKQFKGLDVKHIRTMPYNIHVDNPTVFLFPGQPISIRSVKITDYYGHDTHCTATPYLECGSHDASSCQGSADQTITYIKENQVTLQGKKLLFVESADKIQTTLYLMTKSEHVLPPHIDFKIIIDCVSVSSYLNVTFRACPFSYVFNLDHSNGGTCEKATNNSDLVYDKVSGTVCIKHNYWYGGMTINGKGVNITAPCSLPYCKNGKPCPISGYIDSYYELPWTQDEQCSGLYGGVLCRSCKANSVFTFGASRCLSLSDCRENWQPYLIISLAIGGQIILTIFMISLKPATELGVGYLYGPLFFLAVYKLLPISHSLVHTASHLDVVFSLYQSILLLDLDILGRIPWCFFQSVDQTLIYSFRFLGPLVTFITLTSIVLLAKINLCSRGINKMFPSPIQPMCLLMILSFWSLSNTSIEIIKPVIVSGQWRFAIQPEYEYLGNVYTIVLWCIAIGLLLLIYLPFILLLFFSQCLRAKCDLFRIQPLLDAFQSSYKANCQWYSGIYFLAWVVLSINMPLYFFIIVFGGVIILHFLAQPHKKGFLNICETLLLMDMMILLSLSFLCDHDYCSSSAIAMNYPFLVLPLLYILLGGTWLVFKDLIWKCKAKLKSQSATIDLTAVVVNKSLDREDRDIHSVLKPDSILEVVMEREPLIYDDD